MGHLWAKKITKNVSNCHIDLHVKLLSFQEGKVLEARFPHVAALNVEAAGSQFLCLRPLCHCRHHAKLGPRCPYNMCHILRHLNRLV
jgi:hypothetical protein